MSLVLFVLSYCFAGTLVLAVLLYAACKLGDSLSRDDAGPARVARDLVTIKLPGWQASLMSNSNSPSTSSRVDKARPIDEASANVILSRLTAKVNDPTRLVSDSNNQSLAEDLAAAFVIIDDQKRRAEIVSLFYKLTGVLIGDLAPYEGSLTRLGLILLEYVSAELIVGDQNASGQRHLHAILATASSLLDGTDDVIKVNELAVQINAIR